jgi:ubiquitin C-terminal hydrolase
MNAALQCLMSVVPFVSYFVRNLYLSVIDKKELELNRGVFIKKFTKMLKKYQEYEVLSPWGLKTQVNHFMRSFRGYDQHDSS